MYFVGIWFFDVLTNSASVSLALKVGMQNIARKIPKYTFKMYGKYYWNWHQIACHRNAVAFEIYSAPCKNQKWFSFFPTYDSISVLIEFSVAAIITSNRPNGKQKHCGIDSSQHTCLNTLRIWKKKLHLQIDFTSNNSQRILTVFKCKSYIYLIVGKLKTSIAENTNLFVAAAKD